MDFKDSSDVTIPKEDIPNLLNNYFAKIAEKTSDPNNVSMEIEIMMYMSTSILSLQH